MLYIQNGFFSVISCYCFTNLVKSIIVKNNEQEAFESAVKTMMKSVGEDPEREGLLKTPERVFKAYEFMYGGYKEDPKEVLQSAIFTSSNDEMVLIKDIELRKSKALADKLKKQNQLYNSAAQKAAEELTEVKKDYPKGKTVEEFERYGMKITRTIVIDDEVVRIYMKVVHEWGATYYFKNNQSISGYLYSIELDRI